MGKDQPQDPEGGTLGRGDSQCKAPSKTRLSAFRNRKASVDPGQWLGSGGGDGYRLALEKQAKPALQEPLMLPVYHRITELCLLVF